MSAHENPAGGAARLVEAEAFMALLAMRSMLGPRGVDHYATWSAWRTVCARYETAGYDLDLLERLQLSRALPRGDRADLYVTMHIGPSFKNAIALLGQRIARAEAGRPIGVVVASQSLDQRMSQHPDFLALEQIRMATGATYLPVGSPGFGRSLLSILKQKGVVFAILDGLEGDSAVVPVEFVFGRIGLRSGLFRMARGLGARVTPFVLNHDTDTVEVGMASSPEDSVETAAQRCGTFFASAILRRPEHWLHWHLATQMAVDAGDETALRPDAGGEVEWLLSETHSQRLALNARTDRLYAVDDDSWAELRARVRG